MKKLSSFILFISLTVSVSGQTFKRLTNFPDTNALCTWVFSTSVDNAFITSFETQSLYTTHNGGKTWNSVVLGPEEYDLTDVYFTDSVNGWVCGIDRNHTDGKLFKTSDGGITWKDVTDNIPSHTNALFSSVRFNGLNGIMGTNNGFIGDNNFPLYYLTKDGGITWTIQKTFQGAPSNGPFEILRISNNPADGTFQIAARYNGFINIILNSPDNGLNFNLVDNETTQSLTDNIPFDIYNVEGTVYWLAANSPKKSADGIKYSSFQYPQPNPPTSRILSGFFDAPDKGYIVGDNSAIYKTADGGDTWTTIQHEEDGDVLRNVFKIQKVIWVVGENGAVYKAEDAEFPANYTPLLNRSVRAYPNPSNDYVIIDGTESQNINVYNTLGQDVTSCIMPEYSATGTRLKISGLNPGLYFIEVENNLFKIFKN